MFNLKIAFGGKVGSLIRAGDRAREAKQWHSAITYYEHVVAVKPSLSSIWVQLGHARKENGDLAGAETAYQTAVQLEPNSADTALHLGHLHKVAQRMEDAAAWYRRAFLLDRLNVNAREELMALGRLHDADWATDPLESTTHAQPVHQLLWDCTWHHRLVSIGQFCAEEKWFIKLGVACSKSLDVTPVVFDQEAGRFLRCSFEGKITEGREATSLPTGKDAPIGLVTGVNYRRTAPTELIRMLSAARSQLGMKIFGVVRDAASRATASAANLASVQSLMILGEHATALLVCQGSDRELAEDIARRVGRNKSMVFALDPRSSNDSLAAFVPRARASASASNRILVLEPQDTLDNHALNMQLSALHYGEAAEQPTSWRVPCDESSLSCKVDESTGLGTRIAPAEAWRDLASTRFGTLLIPESRADGDIWAAHALAHGMEVLCHTGNQSVFQAIGAGASYFTDNHPANTETLPSVSRLSDTQPSLPLATQQSDDGLHTPWIRALKTIATASDRFESPVVPANAARYGVYYGSEEVAGTARQYSQAEGRNMLLGAGWGATNDLGTTIANGNAQIQFRLPFPPEDVVVCKALLYRSTGGSDNASLELAWAEFEAEPILNAAKSGAALYCVSIGRACPQSQPQMQRLAGFLIYPKKRDHYWHEFLDQSSRSIRSFRNLPQRLAGSLVQHATLAAE